MNYVQVISVVAYVLCIILFAVMLYFKIKGNAVGAVSELIAMAEETGLSGKEKMALVVSKLHEMVPGIFKGFLTEEKLTDIAQWIFDWMRKYAIAYINSHENPEEPDMGEINDTSHALLEDMINRLSAMGGEALKEHAIKLGLNVEGKSEDEILKEIILAIMMGAQ